MSDHPTNRAGLDLDTLEDRILYSVSPLGVALDGDVQGEVHGESLSSGEPPDMAGLHEFSMAMEQIATESLESTANFFTDQNIHDHSTADPKVLSTELAEIDHLPRALEENLGPTDEAVDFFLAETRD